MRGLVTGLFIILAMPLYAESLNLGILAPQGPEQAQQRWGPFAELLSEEMGIDISLYPVSATEGTEAFLEEYIDLLLGNPVQGAVVMDTMDAQPVASMVKPAGDQFAGVIAVRADSDIHTLADLAGRRLATLGDWAAGGYLFQADHIMAAGMPHPEVLGARVRGQNQNELIAMVMDGTADAAFVRTGIIEGLIEKGGLSAGALRVIDEQGDDMYRSTAWFPEWIMMARPDLSAELIERLRATLTGLDGTSPALQHANISGFVDALDVRPVVVAMQRVGVAPYN